MKYLNSKERQLPWNPNQVIVTYDDHKVAPFRVYAGELFYVLDAARIIHKQGFDVNGKRITADRITAIEVRVLNPSCGSWLHFQVSMGAMVHFRPSSV